MSGFLTAIGLRARLAMRAVLFSVIGVVFGLVGLAFLTVALWMLVEAREGALMAFAVLGGLYIVLSLLLLAIGAIQRRPPVHSTRTAAHVAAHDPRMHMPLLQLAEGFAMGMQAGRAARTKSD